MNIGRRYDGIDYSHWYSRIETVLAMKRDEIVSYCPWPYVDFSKRVMFCTWVVEKALPDIPLAGQNLSNAVMNIARELDMFKHPSWEKNERSREAREVS